MRKYLLSKIPDWHRMRSKIVRYSGQLYYQDMAPEEWEKKKQDIIYEVNDVHTEKELQDWMTKVHATSIDTLENVSYRFYLLPKYNNN
jgi:hypothetical protein